MSVGIDSSGRLVGSPERHLLAHAVAVVAPGEDPKRLAEQMSEVEVNPAVKTAVGVLLEKVREALRSLRKPC